MEATMKTDEHVVAFVDIGTNSVRLLVVRINPNFSYTTICQEKEVVRLGEQEFKTISSSQRNGPHRFGVPKIC
jgi:exopolyphosphatase/guanosine-5'-triphosphate,3'-diphosphate pyrophosphatase